MLDSATNSFDALMRLGKRTRVAGGQPFVHQKNFRRKRRRDSEAEPDHHAGRIGAHRHVDVIAKLGKFGDLVDMRAHTPRMHIHDTCRA